MTPDEHRKAKTVIAWLAKAENPEADEYPIDRVRAERWPEVCAAVEANPDLSAATIAERLGYAATCSSSAAPKHVCHNGPVEWSGAVSEPEDGPVLTRSQTKERIAAAKAALRDVHKPPLGDPPPTTRKPL